MDQSDVRKFLLDAPLDIEGGQLVDVLLEAQAGGWSEAILAMTDQITPAPRAVVGKLGPGSPGCPTRPQRTAPASPRVRDRPGGSAQADQIDSAS